METLICPQCGAQLDESHVTGDVVRCTYCATQFHVPPPQTAYQPQPQQQPYVVENVAPTRVRGLGMIALVPLVMMLMIFTFIGGIFYFVFTSINRTVGTTVNSVLQTANDAKSAANAVKTSANAAKQAANAAANAVANVPVAPTPPKRKS